VLFSYRHIESASLRDRVKLKVGEGLFRSNLRRARKRAEDVNFNGYTRKGIEGKE
jgi:hypothetical protein